ncbi:MAG: glycoside hydrolase family 27 protein [Firmicutes bacterium]|nr:glycoside hydrolase family 27 protein [Bacillota bacterium]
MNPISETTARFSPYQGWNSYDYYCTEVTEEEVLANAAVMAKELKSYGWEYVVIDISWYEKKAGSRSREFQYLPFADLCMDEYARLIPDPERFPSSKDGQGFKPLSDKIHQQGLKFGIHIMRGIPRLAAHLHRPILLDDANTVDAAEIADPSNICSWNPYMYGLRPEHPMAQAYYDSIMKLYASWGVDYIKCDDICREDAPSAHQEIAMLHQAISRCGRDIVLSLSPGPAKITEDTHYQENANLWRITDDFWDTWPLLKEMFRRAELWQGKALPGHYPDFDMLPVGIIGGRFGEKKERRTGFSEEEQRTMMSLWCIFGAPLMIGGELTRLDPFTLDLLTRKDILDMLPYGLYARQLKRTSEEAVWASCSPDQKTCYLALFNLSDEERAMNFWTAELKAAGLYSEPVEAYQELWSGRAGKSAGGAIAETVPAHGVRLIRIG